MPRSGFFLVLVAVVAEALAANPTGGVAIQGQVTFQQSGNLLRITNTPSAIIHWTSFSIAPSYTTRFEQQSTSSAVLNRVVGAGGVIDPSVILGTLQSNGRVFLINPSGILFGAGAQVDVAGLVATSLNLSNADFLAGRFRFTQAPGAGPVLNQGSITTESGGNVYLVGPAVTNNGIITSPAGEVILAAGNSVELVNPGTPNLRVEISASTNEAVNLGQILARSGRIGIYAGMVKTSGTLNADRAVGGPNGEILLKATKSIVMDGGGSASAIDGAISLEAGETITVGDHSLITSDVSLGTFGTINTPGTICPTILQGCGGAPAPSVVIVVGDDQPPQSGGGTTTNPPVNLPELSGGLLSNPPVNLPALSDLARTFQLSNGQVINSLLVTTDLNDATHLSRGASLFSSADQHGPLTFEAPLK